MCRRGCAGGEGISSSWYQVQYRGGLPRPRLGGGLDPGGAWAPSRQRRPISLPTGRIPVRRDAQAHFLPLPRASARPLCRPAAGPCGLV